MFIKQNSKKNHSYFMSLALNQAYINLGQTKENPSVGCVIVNNNNVVSAACTSINGRPHAEQNAIKLLKKKLNNLSIYITLEPCSNYGLTPPCVKEIVKKKINNVFFSIKDSDLRSYNKSIQTFKKYKINVNTGILSDEVNHFYRSYNKQKRNKFPFITSKLAISKDFFTINKKNKYITNEFSRGRVHLMRAQHDSILTTSKTINDDNPLLNCRIEGLGHRSPSRIILDKNLVIKSNSKIFSTTVNCETLVFYNKINVKKAMTLKKMNVKLFWTPLDIDGNLDLKKILIKVKNLGFNRILIESGIKLNLNLLKLNLIDDLELFISSTKLNTNGRGSFKENFNFFLKKRNFVKKNVNLLGDQLITYKLK